MTDSEAAIAPRHWLTGIVYCPDLVASIFGAAGSLAAGSGVAFIGVSKKSSSRC